MGLFANAIRLAGQGIYLTRKSCDDLHRELGIKGRSQPPIENPGIKGLTSLDGGLEQQLDDLRVASPMSMSASELLTQLNHLSVGKGACPRYSSILRKLLPAQRSGGRPPSGPGKILGTSKTWGQTANFLKELPGSCR